MIAYPSAAMVTRLVLPKRRDTSDAQTLSCAQSRAAL
jgi:hypothetical protein